MNEFDQFVKHKIKIKYYVRYADDFVFLSENKQNLINLIPIIRDYLNDKLKLTLHPDKIFLKTLNSGIDFLGWIHFFDYRILRTATKRRIFKRIQENPKPETINSYLGMMKWGNAGKVKEKIEEM
jgi:hypothetical protein